MYYFKYCKCYTPYSVSEGLKDPELEISTRLCYKGVDSEYVSLAQIHFMVRRRRGIEDDTRVVGLEFMDKICIDTRSVTGRRCGFNSNAPGLGTRLL